MHRHILMSVGDGGNVRRHIATSPCRRRLSSKVARGPVHPGWLDPTGSLDAAEIDWSSPQIYLPWPSRKVRLPATLGKQC